MCQHSIVGTACTLSIALAVALAPAPVVAARAPRGAGRAAADRLDRVAAEYAQWVDELESSGRVSGLSTAIVSGKRVVLEKSIGMADTATGEPVTATTVFRLASLSKAFSSALAALLVQDGQLDWDTRLVDVLTYFKLSSDRATRHMTLSDILSHRTGLPHNTFDHRLEDDVSYRTLVRELDTVHLACPVGECYSYQNVAFSMFGDLVYAVTGDFFNHQVEKRLFQPLKMTHATYGRAALEDSDSWARPHVREYGHYVTLVPKPNYYWVSPAAGVNASVRDMEKWLSAQMGEYPDVLSSDVLARLHKPLISTPGQTRFSRWRRARLRKAQYALGWRILDYAGHTMVFHAGAVEGYRAMIGFLPESRVGIVILWNCNCSAPAGLMPMFFDRVLGLPRVNWAGLEPPDDTD